MSVLVLVSAGDSLPQFSISDYLSLWGPVIADEMDAFGSLDEASDALRNAEKLVGTRLCPYMFVFF